MTIEANRYTFDFTYVCGHKLRSTPVGDGTITSETLSTLRDIVQASLCFACMMDKYARNGYTHAKHGGKR